MNRETSAPLKALAACIAGGALCAWLKTPLPWMVGPLFAMALGKFAGADLGAPRYGREAGQIIIGTALGLYFTPHVAREVLSTWPILVAAALLATALGWLCGWFLSRYTGTDLTTAFFASVPGGATEMSVLGERFGGKPDRIALAQSLRILMVVVVIPVAFRFLDVHGSDDYAQLAMPIHAGGMAQLLGLGLLGGALLAWLRVPNAFMLGPLAVTVALTSNELHLSSMPGLLSNIGQLLIGCTLGSRFERSFVRKAPHYMLVVALTILLAMGLAALCGWLLARVGGLAVPTMVLATAPGGIAEMCITAKVLHLGVPLVTAAHVTRVLILVTTTASIFRFVKSIARSKP